MELNDILNAIVKMKEEDIAKVLSAVREARARNARLAVWSINPGDEVEFDAGRRGVIVGKVVKVNSKTVIVNAGSIKWKVAASLLKKVA